MHAHVHMVTLEQWVCSCCTSGHTPAYYYVHANVYAYHVTIPLDWVGMAQCSLDSLRHVFIHCVCALE